MTTESADYCMFVVKWAWLASRVCLLMLEVDLGSVLESELRQKRRYEIKRFLNLFMFPSLSLLFLQTVNDQKLDGEKAKVLQNVLQYSIMHSLPYSQ